ncbi:hypothetical protein [Glacieibacterium frigidum]|uniref:Uncharacterized protein n=1 Tax=Glacieibacterium frigidum TaxID=2593303 RepID=A0A552UIY2_9SPHN|nr:hypothetical protein [Glacieibacterium frigidum]TRW18175.1 hypothetical protein FMM06_08745 [Glacieibacterium frigidum]
MLAFVLVAGLAWVVLRPSRLPANVAAPVAAPAAPPASAAPDARLVAADALCRRGADPLLTGRRDPEFAELGGNLAVTATLAPACETVANGHPDPRARVAAQVVLGRAALANGNDSEWHLRRAEAAAPDDTAVRLLRLQSDIALVEATQTLFNDVSALRARLAKLEPALPAATRASLTARITRAELRGSWNDPAVVRLAVFGKAPVGPVERDARLSFMRGVTDACQSAGFRPEAEDEAATAVLSLDRTATARLMRLRQYSDGTQVGRALDCGGDRLLTAYARVAAPLTDAKLERPEFLDLTEAM